MTDLPGRATSEQQNGTGDADSIGAVVRIPEHVVFRAFPGETVALNLQTGKYHGLNPVAGRMVEVLAASGDVDAAVTVLAGEYEQPRETIEADVRSLCEDLSQRGLVELPGDHPG